MNLRDRLIKLDPLARRPATPCLGSEPERGDGSSEAELSPDDGPLRSALNLQLDNGRIDGAWYRHDRLPDVKPPCWPPPDLSAIIPGIPPDAGAVLAGWQDVLLLDIETTGLAGGTGCLVFLVGLGWWHNDGLHVRQLFLPGPHREPALLDVLASMTARFRTVVTFNGAIFDLPLLRTRARLNRYLDPCADLASWDLLPAARRLWGRQLPNCRQQTVEQLVCGYCRGPGDIAGDQIPGVYRTFLTCGETREMTWVLNHNRRDIEGLGLMLRAMVGAAATIADGPSSWQGSGPAAWSNALICERRKQRLQAARWAGCLVTRFLLSSLPLTGVLDAIRQLKRMADWTLVAAAIDHGLGRWPDEPRLHYEAAVLYEHRLGDARRAFDHAVILQDERRLARLRSRLAHILSCSV